MAKFVGLNEADVEPQIMVGVPMAFVDGHARYIRRGFVDWLGLVLSPNRRAPVARAAHRGAHP